MARKKAAESGTQKLVQQLVELTPESQVEAVIDSLEAFCSQLELSGIDPLVLDAALFSAWGLRYADRNDRGSYEEILESALEEPWDEVTVH